MDISIIIINYNSNSFTVACIDSIYMHTKDLSFEIIVVDNHSDSKDLETLETHIRNSSVTLIKSKVNLGFGGGNHLGYQFATGEHYAFINNDVVLTENSLLKLLQYINSHEDIGLLGLHQVNADNERFKYSYRQFIGFNYHFFRQEKPQKHYSKLNNHDLSVPFEVDIVSGAFMFFKKEAYEKSGGFDPNIFLFYEEMDVCLRLKKAGYKTVFYPESSFIHYQGKSSTNIKTRAEFAISYLYVIQKNFSYAYYCAMRLMMLLKYGFKSILKPKKYGAVFMVILKGGNSLVYSMKIK